MASVSGNEVIIKTTAENDTGRTLPYILTLTYKGTTIQISVVHKCDFYPFRTINIGGVEWMKYNLAKSRLEGGATFATKLPSECIDDPVKTKSHGKFYQWDVGNKSWPTLGAVNDWPSVPMSNSSWIATNDPCPEDYRLPTKDEFVILKNNTTQSFEGGWNASDYGYIIFTSGTNKLEFPAVGFLSAASGSLSRNGMYGKYWSSTQINMTDGYNMDFGYTDCSADSNYSKGYGFNVRCVLK